MDHYQALSRYCSYQERCLQEIEEKLSKLQAPKEEWHQLIQQLETDGFWNEERFARSFARGKFRIKSWGVIRIQYELRMRGIPDILVLKALEEIDKSEYFETALRLVRKKQQEVRNVSDVSARQKVYSYLSQKGFEAQLIREILAKYWIDSE